MIPPNYTRREVKRILRRLIAMRERRDNKDILVRTIDVEKGLSWLEVNYPVEWETIVICGLFQVPFRDAEAILADDHVTLYEQFSSGVAHITDFLNGEVIAVQG